MIARMGWGTFTIRMLPEATGLSYHQVRRILQGYTAKGTVYAGLLEKCPALAVVDATVTDNSTEETVRRHELLFQFDAGRYREWTAGLAVWLEEGCNEGCKEVLEDVEPEPAGKTALSGCDLRSFATPSGAEGVPGLLSIPGTTAGRVQPLPGVLDRGTFVRVKTEIGRCDICDRGKAVYRSREARTNICEGCYSRLVRERNGREGVR